MPSTTIATDFAFEPPCECACEREQDVLILERDVSQRESGYGYASEYGLYA